MADNNGSGLNLLIFHIKEESSQANKIKVEDVDEEIMTTENEVSGGLWVPQYVGVKELPENENGNLENSAEQLLDENAEECSPSNIKVKEEIDCEVVIKTETDIVGGSWVHQNVAIKNLPENENRNLGSYAEQLNLVCQSCKIEYTNDCTNCGHLSHILNNEVEIGTYGRAMDTIPKNILEIKGSLIDGYRVYALRNVPKGVKFGPHEGLETLKKRNKYLWKIRDSKLIEAKGEDYCNWMRYINCATTQSAQNLIALQFMGNIYYKSLREIKIGEELLINYRNSSCDDLGLYRIQYFRPDVEEINENIFKCPPCHFGFSEEKYLVTHKKVCPFKKRTVIEVNGSTDIKENDSTICERINNFSPTHHTTGEIYEQIGLDGREKLLEQDMVLVEHVEINTEDLKKPIILHQHHEKEATSNHSKSKKPKKSTKKTFKLTAKKYKCNECSYAAVRKDYLISHIKSLHIRERSYQCNKCSYAAVQKSALLIHIKQRHSQERPYQCNECSYTALQKGTLQTHMKRHRPHEKPYKCNECPYAAALKGGLQSHIKYCHSQEKPYKCKECSYAAVQKGRLVNHIKNFHNPEKPPRCDIVKPYKCNECSYIAVRQNYLLTHIKQHSMGKLYKCNECSYISLQKGGLLSHIKYQHGTEKPYKCNKCSFAAVQKIRLTTHIKQHHAMEKSL